VIELYIKGNSYIESLFTECAPNVQESIKVAVTAICNAKKKDKNVIVVTGSGPNIHEGITTLIAEMIKKNGDSRKYKR
jgi:carbamate kinase